MLMKTKYIAKNLLLALLPIIVYNLSNLLFGILLYCIFPEKYLDSNYYMMDSLFCLVVLIPFAVWFYRTGHDSANEVVDKAGIRPMLLKIPVLVLGMGGIASLWFIVVENMLQSVSFITDSMQSFDETWSTIGTESYIYVLLSVVILGPIVEELMFRGVMFHYLEKIKTGWFPVVISGVLFGLWHQEPVQVVYTVLMGIIMGAVYLVVHDLKVTMAIHILNNFLSALPPAIDVPVIQNMIYYVSILMIIPAICILVGMLKKDREADALQRAFHQEEENW